MESHFFWNGIPFFMKWNIIFYEMESHFFWNGIPFFMKWNPIFFEMESHFFFKWNPIFYEMESHFFLKWNPIFLKWNPIFYEIPCIFVLYSRILLTKEVKDLWLCVVVVLNTPYTLLIENPIMKNIFILSI